MKTIWVTLLSLSLAGGLEAAQNFGPRPPTPEEREESLWFHHPTNVYKAQEKLPVTWRRVAVLPVTVEGTDNVAESGRATQEAVLWRELGKCRAFEVVMVSPQQLTDWTERSQWSAEEKLPANLMAQIRDATGCDAVLFARLTQYRPYRPVAVGWSLKLVDRSGQTVLWAADEVFDAGNPKVVRSAKEFAAGQLRGIPVSADGEGILLSPSRFGQYAAGALLATLPGR
jgi:hypothetical protein